MKKNMDFLSTKITRGKQAKNERIFQHLKPINRKSQKPEQDFFTQNHVENIKNFFASIGKRIRLKLNQTKKLNYLQKTATFFFSKISKKEIEEVLRKNQK